MAALVLATQPIFFSASQFANMDMLVAACISIAILLGARAALNLQAGASYRGDLAGAYIALALGVLSKGMIGLVIPVLVLLSWLGLARQWRTIARLCWLPGFAAFTVLVLPWFVAVQRDHPGFFHYFFIEQQVHRFASSGFNNVQPIWFYIPVLLLAVLPWSGWLLPNLGRSSPATVSSPAVLPLMWIWLAVVLVFFSIPQSKLIGYILPALPPVAVFVALTASGSLGGKRPSAAMWWGSVGVAVCVCVGLVVAFLGLSPEVVARTGIATGRTSCPE